MACTCSNYGRMADPTVPIDETGVLAPVSLYAEQKVAIEQHLLARPSPYALTCLRFATVYGVAPRMRFDLTVNEFTRDLWADRELEVFGEQFWRPYVHVRDAARGIRTVLEAPTERRRRGLQRRRLGRELPQARPRRGDPAADRPRRRSSSSSATRTRATTRSASSKIQRVLGFEITHDRPGRHRRGRSTALDERPLRRPVRSPLPQHPVTMSPEIPLFDLRLEPEDLEAVAGRAALAAG